MADPATRFRLTEPSSDAIPLEAVDGAHFDAWLQDQDDATRRWVTATGYTAKAGKVCLLPTSDGALKRAVVAIDPAEALWNWGGLPSALPAGRYALEGTLDAPDTAALGWALGVYVFDRYRDGAKASKADKAELVWPDGCDKARVTAAADATWLARDLVNIPASDMGPSHLAAAADEVAARFGASIDHIVGDDLLAQNYPAIHAVGRAASLARAPRLIDMTWGDVSAPKVTLVGKGVCFDTGGLDIKPASAMKLMKKDMGGAANLLGAASLIMALGLPVRLRLLIPAVENSIAGDAMRPLDVVTTRAGKTIEIGHTDAEGRVILADALWEAASEKPDLLVDFATLTGAARVALGTELPALFCDDDGFADGLVASGRAQTDPMWRLPLWTGYRAQVDGKVADLTNAPEGGYGGAITAALFLKEFTQGAKTWAHVDLMAWNVSAKPGRPEGGEAMGLRALVAALEDRFCR